MDERICSRIRLWGRKLSPWLHTYISLNYIIGISRNSFVNSADEDNEAFYIIWGYLNFCRPLLWRETKFEMDKANYAETALGYNNRNKANFISKWFFWYLNPTFTKGSKDRVRKWSCSRFNIVGIPLRLKLGNDSKTFQPLNFLGNVWLTIPVDQCLILSKIYLIFSNVKKIRRKNSKHSSKSMLQMKQTIKVHNDPIIRTILNFQLRSSWKLRDLGSKVFCKLDPLA